MPLRTATSEGPVPPCRVLTGTLGNGEPARRKWLSVIEVHPLDQEAGLMVGPAVGVAPRLEEAAIVWS